MEDPETGQRRRRIWATALVLALLLHLGVALAVGRWHVLAPPPEETPPAPVELVFSDPPEAETFVEQPDRDDPPPDPGRHPSNVASRSSSLDKRRTDDDVPSAAGRSQGPSSPTVRGSPEPPADAAAEEDAETPESLTTPSLLGMLARRAPLASPSTPGTFDLTQEAMERALNGAAIRDGDIRLSTYAWEYAPWLQAFRRDVLEHWNPPAAYYMGLIDGWCAIRIEIGRDGRPLSVRTTAEDVGHRSLTSAAHLALDGAAPYRRLPDAFPEPTLVLDIRFTYLNVRRSPPPQGAVR